jgi:DNA-binding MarR family transcriptional regulator
MTDTETLVAVLQEAFAIFRRRLMDNLFSYVKDNGLSMPQFGAMTHIYHSGGCGVSDIGNDLGVSNSAASQMLDRLVQVKLISRSEDPSDRRGKLLVLTDKGREILVKGSLSNQMWLEDLAHSMTPDEQEQVRQAITVLVDKARQLETTLNNRGVL